jgi:thioredoxin-dependent peroxiredoxin
MKRQIACVVGCCVLASPLYAALKPGAQAPDFTTEATLAGQPFKFALADALKSGPVVLYFYPAAFTKGCTVTLNKFSVSECRNKFAVASEWH